MFLYKRNIYIRKSIAVLLLAIFALSNTPTKYLHKLFANHVDFVSKTITNSSSPQLNAAGIDCHCESNVVIAPYTFENGILINPLLPVYIEYTLTGISTTVFSQSISFGLRGPPSLA
jgi:hypothetical protein